eukprot:5176569-Prymnesium_polylepis.1
MAAQGAAIRRTWSAVSARWAPGAAAADGIPHAWPATDGRMRRARARTSSCGGGLAISYRTGSMWL